MYYPSANTKEGEILVKGKTLGRWGPKKYIVDFDQRIFALKRSDPKKKFKVYELVNYQVSPILKKEKRYQFDLQSQIGGKNVPMGSESEQISQTLYNQLKKLSGKQEIPERQSIKVPQPLQQFDYEIPSYFDIVNIRESINSLRHELNLEKFDLVFNERIKVYKSQTNPLLFKVISIIDGNQTDICLKSISNTQNIHQWNQFVQDTSQKIKDLSEDKSYLISEIRKMINLFPFKREFYYLRHTFKIENTHFVLERSLEQKSNTNLIKGHLKYSVWMIAFKSNQTHLQLVTEQSFNGLAFPEEDSFIIQKYLEQIENIGRARSSQKIEPLSIDLKQHDQVVEKIEKVEKVEKLEKIEKQFEKAEKQQQEPEEQSQKLSLQEDEEFFDCAEDYDAINDKLFLAQDQRPQDDEIIKISRQSVQIQAVDHLDNLQLWTDNKMKDYLSGLYCAKSINQKHQLGPIESDINSRILVEQIEGANYLYRQDFVRDEKNGGLKIINEEKLAVQKSVIKFLITRIGAQLMMGKSITGISMPVTIFEPRSNTERVCGAMGFGPIFLDDAARNPDKYYRMVQTLKFSFGFLYTYLSMEKPFNPILGETFQGFFDNCPVYCEQISHHPPICVTIFYGRGFRIDSRLELQANFHSNSVVGKNLGQTKIIFDNPYQEITVMMAPGGMSGTTYGDKVMNYFEKQICIDVNNKIMGECTFNPDKKYCQFFQQDYQNFQDYVVGGVFDVSDSAINKFQKETYRKYKGVELKEIKQTRNVVSGFWTKNLKMDNQRFLSVYEDAPMKLLHSAYPIASDANFRMDVLYWKLKNFDESQAWKEKLEILQRNDRKLREAQAKKKKK